MSRPLATALVLAGLVGLVGCGGSHRGSVAPSDAPTSSPPPRQTVDVRNYAFSPRNITVPIGTTVTWVQDDGTLHTVTDAGIFDSGVLSRGQRFSYTFRIPGTYHYDGTIHPGMAGSVTVQ